MNNKMSARKILLSLLGLEITYMRVFKSQELDFDHKITLEISIASIQVGFADNVNLGPRKIKEKNKIVISCFLGSPTFPELIASYNLRNWVSFP